MRLTIVTPWFGTERPGGAETLARLYAEALARRGHQVTLATTTTRGPLYSWTDDWFSRGEQDWPFATDPAPAPRLIRFATDRRRQVDYEAINQRIVGRLTISIEEEEAWLSGSINSRPLMQHLAGEAAREVLLVLPYPFGISYIATYAFGPRTVLAPCLHAEGYAVLSLTGEMMAHAGGFLFNTPEEEALARRLFALAERPTGIAGPGLDLVPIPGREEIEGFRRSRADGRPYLLYLGWRDVTKGLDVLFAAYNEVATRHARRRQAPPKLLLAGPGEISLPAAYTQDIVDVGYLSPEDKVLALAGAEWLVQPSQNESYSLVMMEAWRVGTPCLVNALCEVTRGHVERSNGGLWFASGEELDAALEWGVAHPSERVRLGQQGRAYVGRVANWDALLPRIESVLAAVGERAGLSAEGPVTV